MSRRSEELKKYTCEDLADLYISKHDNEYFSEIVRRIQEPLRCYVASCKILNDPDDVEDAVSVTYESMLKGIHTFDPKKSKFITWAYTIGRNSAIHIKKDKTKLGEPVPFTTKDDVDDDDWNVAVNTKNDMTFTEEYSMHGYSENSNIVSMSKDDIMENLISVTSEVLDSISVEKRLVLKEKYINHKKMSDISSEFSIPISSVKNWLRTGKKAILDKIKENDKLVLQAKEIDLL